MAKWSFSGKGIDPDTVREQLAGERNRYLAGKDEADPVMLAQIETAIDRAADSMRGESGARDVTLSGSGEADDDSVSVSITSPSGAKTTTKATVPPADSTDAVASK